MPTKPLQGATVGTPAFCRSGAVVLCGGGFGHRPDGGPGVGPLAGPSLVQPSADAGKSERESSRSHRAVDLPSASSEPDSPTAPQACWRSQSRLATTRPATCSTHGDGGTGRARALADSSTPSHAEVSVQVGDNPPRAQRMATEAQRSRARAPSLERAGPTEDSGPSQLGSTSSATTLHGDGVGGTKEAVSGNTESSRALPPLRPRASSHASPGAKLATPKLTQLTCLTSHHPPPG
eukprot:CAMPEP_0114546956 /NCGR_PEP_ID=MMETSP0114-20121206/4208_1 /TAXON_ID=31324 /ORGANISM="Goniomonas sp, Strain m" /LENGTH=235 /DNA_ID=CAMNT_0001731481 /DNA_START=21 /DNA_END=729 /DNA_ORIENTATION=-